MAGYYQAGTMLRAEWEELQKGTVAQLRTSYEEYLKRLGINSEAEAIAIRAKEEAEGKGFGAQQAAIDAGVFGTNTRADRKISDAEEAANQAAQLANDSYAAKQIQALSGGRITGREPVYIFGTPEHNAYMKAQMGSGRAPVAPDAYLDAQAFADRLVEYSRLGADKPTSTTWDDATKQYVTQANPFFNAKVLEPVVGMGTAWSALNNAKWATVGAGGRTAATEQAEYDILNFFSNTVGGLPAGYRFFMRTPGDIVAGAPTPTPAGTPVPAGTTAKTVVSTATSGLVDEATKALQKQIDDLKSQVAASKLAYDTAAQDKADGIKAERVSAYTTLKTEFDKYGLGSLVDDVKNLILNGTPKSEATLKLRATDAYQLRFAGNKARLAMGKNLYDESTYLGLEDDFQASFEAYGQRALLGNTRESGQAVFADFIATDKSPTEIKDRIRLAVEEVRDRKDIRTEFQKYFPEISDSDLVSYFLKPQQTLTALTAKVRVAQIGSAASRQNLTASLATATDLEQLGITEQQAKDGYKKVATDLPAIEKLGAIDNVNINQTTAENAYIKGLASEQRKLDQAAERERNRFAQSSGINKVSLTSANPKSII